jgi:general L-amino acid transport system substrate-binding protein
MTHTAKALRAVLLPLVAAAVATPAAFADTLADVRAKGHVQCGVSQGLPGFSNFNDAGEWSGLDVDMCRAVAAAVFGDASKHKVTPLSAKERFTALKSSEIDVLTRNTTWTMSRDTNHGDFAGVNYYDGQGMMVRKSLGVKSALELGGASICTNTGTTTELNIADYFRANNMEYELVAFENTSEVNAAYVSGRCDVFTTDQSGLYAERLKFPDKDKHMVLPEVISKEPLGPMTRNGDSKWTDIVRWSHNAMVNAEEMGVTSANVDSMKSGKNPAVLRLLGVEGSFGEDLGLSKDWAFNIIKQVGNYGESFERNVGVNTPLGISRGLNQLWTKGGLMYAPPVR